MKSHNRIAMYLVERENAYCARGIEPPRTLENESVSRISYFMEDSVVFRGKCAVSILSLSPRIRGEAENIHCLRGKRRRKYTYHEIEQGYVDIVDLRAARS